MDIVVIGAGMAGLHTAWACARRGANVTVIESARGPLQAASYGSGGYIGPDGVRPLVRPLSFAERTWLRCSAAKPTMPLRYSVAERSKHPQFVKRYVDNCTPERARYCQDALTALVQYNARMLDKLVLELDVEDFRTQRVLHLFGPNESLTKTRREQLQHGNVKWLDARQCRALEPGFTEHAPISGGYHHPLDQTINATYVARQIAGVCQQNGVQFLYGTAVKELIVNDGVVRAVTSEAGLHAADVVVLCHAGGVTETLTTAGIKLQVPMTPLTSCSVSADMGEAPLRVRNGLQDESNSVFISVLDDRLRAVGSPFIGSLSNKELESEYRRIYTVATTLLGNAAQWNQAKYWSHTVWAMPDSLPLVGAVPGARGLYVSAAHGMTGAACTCAAANIIADQIEGKVPAIDLCGAFACDRFAK